jgi:O-antigen/teichoic acid export membrane protein
MAQVAVYVLGFVASILIARGLGPAGRGEYYLPVTAGMTAMTIMHLSLESSNTYFFAERRFSLSELARNAGALALVLGPLGSGLMWLVFALTRDSVFEGVEASDFAIATLILPVQLHLLWLGSILQLAKRVSKTQRAVAAGAVAQLLLIASLYVADELTVTAVLIGYALSLAVPWALQLRVARGVVSIRPQLRRQIGRPVVRFALKLHLGVLFLFLLLRADVFLVGYYLDSAAVGVYSLAVIFGELALMLTQPLVIAALPYQSQTGFDEAAGLSFRVARTNGLIALGLALVLAAGLWLFIPLLYGSDFGDAYAALVLLLPGIVAMAVARPLGPWLIRRANPLLVGGLALGAFAVNIGLNAVLIPEIGINGASLASSLSYIGFGVAFVTWGLRVSGIAARDALVPRPEEIAQLRDFVARPSRRALGWLRSRG